MRRAAAFATSYWVLVFLALAPLLGGRSARLGIESLVALIVILVLQVMLLVLPSRISEGSQVTRGLLLVPLVASGLLLGLLSFGIEMAVGEYARLLNDSSPWTLIPPLVVGIGTVAVMYRKSGRVAARELLRKQQSTLLIAGVLAVLVTIPAHILTSRRGGFLVGIGTALGLIISVLVTLFALGQMLFARIFMKNGQGRGPATRS